jgi:hypothetical protein
MRKHSESFPFYVGGAAIAIYAVLQNAYQNAFQAWFLEELKERGYQDQLALFVTRLLPIVPNLGLAIAIVWLVYWYVKRDFEERIRPRLKCSFSMADTGCVRPNTRFSNGMGFAYSSTSSTSAMAVGMGLPTDNPGTLQPTTGVSLFSGPTGTYYRLKVACDGIESVSNCRGRLETINKNGVPVNWEPCTLPFVSAQSVDSLAKRIHSGSPEHLDFMFISDSNRVQLTPPDFRGSSSVDWQNLFNETAIYVLRINILSDANTVACDLTFRWTGDRATSEITCQPVNL